MNKCLRKEIAIPSNLGSNANLSALKSTFNSLFESQLKYGTQPWSQKSNKTIAIFRKLHKPTLKKITFKKCHNPKSRLQIILNIEFPDILNLQNSLFKYQTQQCPKLTAFKLCRLSCSLGFA